MSEHKGEPTVFEDIYDAINWDLARSRVSRKEISCMLYPGRRPETAMALFSRAMNPYNQDVHLSVDHLIAVMHHTGGQHTLHYLCDETGYEIPEKKDREALAEERKKQVDELLMQIREVAKKIDVTVKLDGEGHK